MVKKFSNRKDPALSLEWPHGCDREDHDEGREVQGAVEIVAGEGAFPTGPVVDFWRARAWGTHVDLVLPIKHELRNLIPVCPDDGWGTGVPFRTRISQQGSGEVLAQGNTFLENAGISPGDHPDPFTPSRDVTRKSEVMGETRRAEAARNRADRVLIKKGELARKRPPPDEPMEEIESSNQRYANAAETKRKVRQAKNRQSAERSRQRLLDRDQDLLRRFSLAEAEKKQLEESSVILKSKLADVIQMYREGLWMSPTSPSILPTLVMGYPSLDCLAPVSTSQACEAHRVLADNRSPQMMEKPSGQIPRRAAPSSQCPGFGEIS
mmetsp:Transcript_14451/g.29547  ORF Transcript_14451/g.29547 Transcript_14451/m.29547 type:complete len:323 (+) Transcript_14451:99-1067(+)